MKEVSKDNEGYGTRGGHDRCPNRWTAAMPWKGGHTQFGWHWCNLRKGHPGPCQCVHGEQPEGTSTYVDSTKGPIPRT